MTARRNADGDSPLWQQVVMEAKCAVKRRLASRGEPVVPPPQPYLIVPVIGQSNAQGEGRPVDASGEHPRVHQLARSGPSRGRIVVARDPLLHDVPTRGLGFGTTFARELAEATGRFVLLVPAARGDTAFAPKNGYTWDPENTSTRVNLFLDAVDAIDAALKAPGGGEIAVMLWHQGESDGPLTTADRYRDRLLLLIDRLRERYGSAIPFMIGGMVAEHVQTGHPNLPNIDNVHREIPRCRERTVFVEGPVSMVNSAQDLHYSAAGQQELGRRLWAGYRSLAAADLGRYALD